MTRRADYVGSTKGIIDFARKSDHKEFIIGTEMGVLHILRQENPDKQFFLLTPSLFCANMKKTRIADVRDALLYHQYEITLDQNIMDRARLCLERMLSV